MDWKTFGPLVGVVVGAVLGGLAQIVNSNIAAHRQRRHALLETRRTAYVEFLRCCSQMRTATFGKGSQSNEQQVAVLDGAIASLDCARSELVLVAPVDTASAGHRVADTHLQLAWTDAEGTKDARAASSKAHVEFLKLAKRDLGLVDA